MTKKQTAREQLASKAALKEEADSYRNIIGDAAASSADKELALDALVETENLIAGGTVHRLPAHVTSTPLAKQFLISQTEDLIKQENQKADVLQLALDKVKVESKKERLIMSTQEIDVQKRQFDQQQEHIDKLRRDAESMMVRAGESIKQADEKDQAKGELLAKFQDGIGSSA